MSGEKDSLFSVEGQVAVMTGAGGVLIGGMARELALRGAHVVVVDRAVDQAQKVAEDIRAEGGAAEAVIADVLDRKSLGDALSCVMESYGRVDILINGAGGNRKEASTSPELSFFDMPADALKFVMDLNLLGTIFPTQVFGRIMARQKKGVILNISSMNSFRPLTKIIGYSAAKAAINNVTQWLAVHLAQNYAPEIRVNAIAPGFFETAQNKFLLRDEKTGELTARGQQIVGHTPMGRFGVPADLMGTLIWLVSPASAFVTGIVVPVDGGFSAYSGV
ncbi:MAG: SDR family oxidoreductase [Verrucomicrobia bacterium]|nr:SDR family oxidoreductase [Verrucomicrobiota bacterium]